MESSARLFGACCRPLTAPEAYPRRAYHVQIWRTRRPVFCDDIVVLFVDCDDSGTMARGVVIHKDEVLGWVSLLEGQDDVTQNFIIAPGGGDVAFDDLQGDPIVGSEACPHRTGSTTL